MKTNKVLLFLLHFTISFFLQAQKNNQVLYFDGTWQKKDVPSIFYYFEDKSKKLSVYQILNPIIDNKFEKAEGSPPSFWTNGNPYWFRFNLENATYVNQELYFVSQIPLYDDVDFYLTEKGRIIEKQHFSWRIPQYKRIIKHRNFIIPFTLHSKQKLVCYVRINRDFGSVWLPIKIWQKNHFDYHYLADDYHGWGVMTGVFSFVAFFSFMFSFAFKDRVYAYYAAYVICALGFVYTMQGYFIRFYFDGSWGVEGDKVRYVATLLLIIANVLFVRLYLQWDQLTRKTLWKISNIMLVVLTIVLLLMYIDNLLLDNFIFNYAKQPISVFYSLMLWVPIVIQYLSVIYCIKINHNRQIATYYLLANSPIFIISIFSIFSTYGFVSGFDIVEVDYFALSFLIEILILSVLMAYRVKLVQDGNENLLFDRNLQLQQRTQAVLEAEERERIRIARDLHDGVGQLLAAARMSLAKFVSVKHIDAYELNNASELLEEGIKEIREVSHNMMPGTLTKFGIASALKQLVNKLTLNEELKVSLQIVGIKERLDDRVELMLFRIIQEIMSNIIRHSKASKVSIELIKHEEEVILIIEDNGIGFDTNNPENQGIGLKNIATRVEYLNGSVIFDSSLDRGTSVIVEVPL